MSNFKMKPSFPKFAKSKLKLNTYRNNKFKFKFDLDLKKHFKWLKNINLKTFFERIKNIWKGFGRKKPEKSRNNNKNVLHSILNFVEGIMAKLNLSIKYKIITVVVSAVLVPMLISTYVSGSIVAEKIESGFKSRVMDTLQSALYYYNDYQKRATDNAAILSSVTELKQYLVEKNNLRASQFLVQLSSEVGLDFIMLADDEKKLLSRTDQPARFGDDLSNDFMVKSGLAGYRTVGVMPSDKGVIIQSVSPIKSDVVATGVKTIGVIVTQYNLDQRFVDNIKKMNGVEATLYVNNNVISTLLDDKNPRYEKIKTSLAIDSNLQSQLLTNRQPLVEKKKIDGRLYSVAYTVLEDKKKNAAGIISIAAPLDEVIHAKDYTTKNLILICLGGLFVGAMFGTVTSGGIVKPIKKLVDDTRIVAAGNLTYKSESSSKDEIGQLAKEFNTMADSLRDIVIQISTTVNESIASSDTLTGCVESVKSISQEVEQTSEAMKEASNQQATYLVDANMEITHVAASASDISLQTEEIVKFTNKAMDVVSNEEMSLNNLAQKMGETKRAIIHTSDKINYFKSNLKQIGNMTELITNIASQTKLLALNAAIEAARAGQAGKGFSVVASEIRKLSDQSNQSVVNINGVIKKLFEDMEETTNVVRTSVEQVESSNEIVNKTTQSFNEIVRSINEVNNMISDIAKKSNLQAANTEKITNIIRDLNEISVDTKTKADLLNEGSVNQGVSLDEAILEMEKLMENMHRTNEIVKKFTV